MRFPFSSLILVGKDSSSSEYLILQPFVPWVFGSSTIIFSDEVRFLLSLSTHVTFLGCHVTFKLQRLVTISIFHLWALLCGSYFHALLISSPLNTLISSIWSMLFEEERLMLPH
ncbi:unnamed protein product [Linum trigynum]|uniref:Uncharacterized protein n=1 Tax=Linum trigynum TaxID=586398 RepID=A0AAV2E9D0_9ROSI